MAAKLEQALVLTPATELHFKPPFDDVNTSYLTLTNPTNKNILFKVKTTAPKTYCVRPNGGTVEAKKSIKIHVMLQPTDLETAQVSKHKFMVQSIFAPEGDYDLDTVWRNTLPEAFMNSKLKCIFDTDGESSEKVEEVEIARTKEAETTQESPKASIDTSLEAVVQKLKISNKHLLNEFEELRRENYSLKEEGLRYRKAYDTKSKGTLARPDSHASDQAPISTNTLIIVAFLVFFIGLYIGKYVI